MYVGLLLEVLQSLDPSVQPEAVVYSMGAVKLLCSNGELRSIMVSQGIVKITAGLLRKLKEVCLCVLCVLYGGCIICNLTLFPIYIHVYIMSVLQ